MAAVTGLQIPYASLAQTVLPNVDANQPSFILRFIKAGIKIPEPLAQNAEAYLIRQISSGICKNKSIHLGMVSVVTEIIISALIPSIFNNPNAKKLSFILTPALTSVMLSLGLVLIAKSKNVQGLMLGTLYSSLLSAVGYSSNFVNKSHNASAITDAWTGMLVSNLLLYSVLSITIFPLRETNKMIEAGMEMTNLQYENIEETNLEVTELNHPDVCGISHESTDAITQPVHIVNRPIIYKFDSLKGWLNNNPIDPIDRETIITRKDLRRINPNLLTASPTDENV